MLSLLAFDYYLLLLRVELTTQLLMLSLGYRKREPIYGSVLFAQAEWVQVSRDEP